MEWFRELYEWLNHNVCVYITEYIVTAAYLVYNTYECTQIMSLQMKKENVVCLCPYMDLSGFPLQIHVRVRNAQ